MGSYPDGAEFKPAGLRIKQQDKGAMLAGARNAETTPRSATGTPSKPVKGCAAHAAQRGTVKSQGGEVVLLFDWARRRVADTTWQKR